MPLLTHPIGAPKVAYIQPLKTFCKNIQYKQLQNVNNMSY